MAESKPSDLTERIQELRAEHRDPKAFVDALQAEFLVYQASEARIAGPLAEEALRISREIGYDYGEAIGILQMGFVAFLWQRNQEAFALIYEAQAKLEPYGDKLSLARCATILTGLNSTIGNYQKAIEHAHEAIALLDGVPDGLWHGWPQYMLGDAYRLMGELEQARTCYQEGLDIMARLGAEGGQSRSLIGLGCVCRDLGDYEQSEKYFDEALKLAEKRHDPVQIARLLSDRAILREKQGHPEAALNLFEESLAIRRKTNADLIIATCLIDLGKLLVTLDRSDDAIKYLTEAIALAKKRDHKPRIFAAHEALSRAYVMKGDLDQALEHHKMFQQVKEEVMSADAATRVRNLEISLEAAAAQKEAALVHKHNEELTAKNTELARLLKELQDAQELLIQSEKMASLGQLTAGIAHEIRNPLNFVNNFSVMTKDLAEELAEEIDDHRSVPVDSVAKDFLELTADIRENALRIMEHGGRAGQVVNRMLVHTRHSGGKKSDVDVNELTETCIDLAYHGFVGNHEGFELHIERDLGEDLGTFNVIEEDLASVITNVLNNALYATYSRLESGEDGYKPRVDVRTSVQDGYVNICIADNGFGIPDEHKTKVFEPFFTTKPTGSGTGLGLSQSFEITTKRHGGSLKVEDTPGGGATLVISIPAA